MASITEWRDRTGAVETRDESSNLGGSMRLGAQEVRLQPGTLMHTLYGRDAIHERHRHRYEFNNGYLERMRAAGLVVGAWAKSAAAGDLCEMIELPDHPWFFGCQFHPEFTSNPRRGHPLFVSFVRAALEQQRRGQGGAAGPVADLVASL